MPKQVKNILKNGLCIVGVRRRISNLVQLSLSDFNRTDKLWFDLSEKKLLGECSVRFTDEDYKIMQEYLSEEKV